MLGDSDRAEAQVEILTEDATKTYQIEGELLSREDVRSSLAKHLGIQAGFLSPGEKAVDGIVQVMLDATQNTNTRLDAERLHSWHAALFPTGRSGMHVIPVGRYRTEALGPMQVVSGALGAERVHFEAPPASRVEREMSRFLDWLSTTGSDNPVLEAGKAHLWFLTIHPYADGNGRLARVISDAILSRGAERQGERWFSVSAAICDRKADYYRQLERQQRGSLDISDWQRYFVSAVQHATDLAEHTIDSVMRRAMLFDAASSKRLNERQYKVLHAMLQSDWQGRMTSGKYARMTKCSQDTATRDLQALVADGLFEVGRAGGRSTSYAPVTEIRGAATHRGQARPQLLQPPPTGTPQR